MKYIKSKRAFTLVELMTVIAVISILLAVAVPTFIGAKRRANADACRANLEIIMSAEKEWALDNPDTAVAGYTITSANVGPYIDGDWASLNCPDGGNYSMPAILADGSIPPPLCSIGGEHAL